VNDPTVLPERDIDADVREVGSLGSRMQQRAAEIEQATSERFPVPGWESILEVELALVSWERLRRVVTKYERLNRQPAMQELYTAADQILLATLNFYEVPEQGGPPKLREDHDWVSLARATGKPLPDDLTPRMAVIHLCSDVGTLALLRDWGEWMQTRRGEVDKEVQDYFARTQ
jgi:hypothetical protein